MKHIPYLVHEKELSEQCGKKKKDLFLLRVFFFSIIIT